MDTDFLRHKFGDGVVGIISKGKFKIGLRHVQMLYMFVCSIALGTIRGSTGVAVLSINDVTRRNDTYIQVHDWNSRTQGLVLSAFCFGYALLVVPAELFLKKIGGKLLISIVLMINGLLAGVLPTIVNKGGWMAAGNAMLLLGMAQAGLVPAQQALLSKWCPPNEKMFGSGVYSGIMFGIIIGMPISGLLTTSRLGWELVFYGQAIILLSVATICVALMASCPEKMDALGEREKEFVQEALKSYKKKGLLIPWRQILRDRAFWAVACAHAASSAIFVFYLFNIPAFLLCFDLSIKRSATFSTFPFILLWLTYTLTSSTLNWLASFLNLGCRINITHYRKTLNALGACGVTAGLYALPYLQWSQLLVFILTATLGLNAFQFSGFLETLRDMTQNYAGTLMMLTSAAGAIAGTAVPLMTGMILGDDMHDIKRWRIVFVTLASFCIACNIIYTVLGSGERQAWDGGTDQQKKGYRNDLINPTQVELEELGTSKNTPDESSNSLI